MKNMNRYYKLCSIRFTGFILAWILSFPAKAQLTDSLPLRMSLDQCVDYAIKHQPSVQQAKMDEAITETTIKSKLADWYPQLNLNYNIQHYLQQPIITSPFIAKNSSTTTLSLTQNIINSDVLLASKTAGDVRLNSRQYTQLSKIDIAVVVSKTFYDVLVSQQQIQLLSQDILRLQKSLKDAVIQYQAGTVDKTDYKRATIALNNSLALKKQYEELLKGKWSLLKQQIGYTGSGDLSLDYDNRKLEDEIILNDNSAPLFQKRVEYQQLETQKRLLQYNLKYARWSYLPNVSFFGYYNLVGQNEVFSKTYSAAYPNSLFGITLGVPIFQGTKRIQMIRQAELLLHRQDWDFQNLKASINTEYISALAVYNASLNDYTVSKDNLSLAREVYTTIQLQYKSGLQTYLDVIIAETDLRTAEVSNLDALYQVLSSKLDVQKAAGAINY
ncbi:MAG: outer rane efflux protein [Chitinophagaceae bacterium]|nr:outer rane efflux protein [Chitinophagaceae bacterium]